MARRGERGAANAKRASRNKARSQNRPVPKGLRCLSVHRVLCSAARLAGTHFGLQRGSRGIVRYVLAKALDITVLHR